MAISALNLTKRDIEIIIMVYSYNGVLVSHLRRKFWPDVSSRTSYYRRINKLIEAGYLQVNNHIPLSTNEKLFLTIGPSSRPLLSEWLGVSPTQLEHSTKTVSPFIIAHRAAVADVRLSLELAAERYPWIRSLEWHSEGEIAREPMQVKEVVRVNGQLQEQIRNVLPDGAFSLITNTHSYKAYIEVDMGTVPHRLSQKLHDYLLLEKGREKRIPVLFVVSENFRLQANRSNSILQWAQEQAQKLGLSPQMFWVAKREDISEQTILTSPIWHVAGRQPGQLQPLNIEYAEQVGPNSEYPQPSPSL
jgi:hypothetical protein